MGHEQKNTLSINSRWRFIQESVSERNKTRFTMEGVYNPRRYRNFLSREIKDNSEGIMTSYTNSLPLLPPQPLNLLPTSL